jgi:hypothetical protein
LSLKRRLKSKLKKKKKAFVFKALKDLLAKAKSLTKPKKALICKKKVIRFVSSNFEEVVLALSQKYTLSGHIVKTLVIFEKGI